jgi:hypothetical protein
MKDDHCEPVTIVNKWLVHVVSTTLPRYMTKSGQSNRIIMSSYMARILTYCLATESEMATSLLPKPGAEQDVQ